MTPKQQPVAADLTLPFAIFPDELAALHRFYETTEDGQDYDVPVPMMKRMATIGLVRRVTGNRYQFTDFGLSVRNGDFDAALGSAPATPVPAELQNSAPRRIYLDIGDPFALEGILAGTTDWQVEGVTWSEDNATSHGVEYVRADLANLVSHGWKVVPINPTFRMCEVGREAGDIEFALPEDIYRAMLDAAPASAPATQAPNPGEAHER